MCTYHIHYTVTPSHDRYISRNNTLGSYTYYQLQDLYLVIAASYTCYDVRTQLYPPQDMYMKYPPSRYTITGHVLQ